ncbi:nickel-responsive transcriptional regulator NikR [Methylobacterium sp. 88A]|uniref:nickel-responsive transcriptional regulator NikR n=1 Tax=Methylobacterium sp. 88A TaxID=1131813 RepID=UPI000378E8CF|nr:nickel-responsive transcriptional regulator NikR [Methylobacterium sp. 88A]
MAGGDETELGADDGAVPEEGAGGRRKPVSRISLSLSEDLLCELDTMVGERGFASRSQAVATILHRSLVEHRHKVGDRVMVGTITLFYDHLAPGVQQRLADLQRRYIAEVISSLHVHLMNNQTLEVVLVQGPAATLQTIADTMITERGVISGRLELAAALIPPIHPFQGEGGG